MDSVIKKAEEDDIITEDERELIEEIRIESENLQQRIQQLDEDRPTKIVLQKVLANSSRLMLKNLISKAREDGKISQDEQQILEVLFDKLGFDLNNFNSRPWFNFKICIRIDEKTPVESLLNHFDKVFCLRGLDPTQVYSGLCLGTKHYVIEDVDVTLLAFALTPDNTKDWVSKGAFATIDFSPNFNRLLHNTAYDLLVENYLAKIR